VLVQMALGEAEAHKARSVQEYHLKNQKHTST